ncbi:acyl carrier protein [Micromonospora andamanensis]|uniref:Acyl carrier protein n=1 Tax=Micromonospora andamanensis TaxID=1287068 RepID=A0ABQ4HZN4_9ACTN|nr:hypothetical protein [Micromonospora andamanensis]GIJ11075.1 hypothetical protein Van01_42890 [Micromonospora andamanensis]GIJ39761.1 hypothetical protein Vwe01_30860 [Micromonospora andamanensis]
MIGQAEFIRIVRDELRLPLADPDLEHSFDQEVNWRSLHRVRLFVAMEQHAGRRPEVGTLFEERTVRGIYTVFAEQADGRRDP